MSPIDTSSNDEPPMSFRLGSVSNDDPSEAAEISVQDPVAEIQGNAGAPGPEGFSAKDLIVRGTAPLVRPPPQKGPNETLIGSDDRTRIFDTDSAPWKMICSLSIRGSNGAGFVGTGWFAGPRTIITAGHCVHEAGLGGWAAQIEVRAGRNGQDEPFKKLICKRFSTTDRWKTLRDPDYDYAAIHLDSSADEITNVTGWFSTAVMADAGLVRQRVNVSGYPVDKGTTNPKGSEQWFHASQVLTVTPLRMFYDVDTVAGQSGAPVWLDTDAGPRVVGIHAYGVGAAAHLGITANSAPRITLAVLDVIKAWIQKP